MEKPSCAEDDASDMGQHDGEDDDDEHTDVEGDDDLSAPYPIVHVSLQSTCYDATVLALTTLGDNHFRSVQGVAPLLLQLVLILVLHVASIALQLVMISLLLVTAVMQKESPYRHTLPEKVEVLHEAIVTQVPLQIGVPLQATALAMCAARNMLPVSHGLIMFLWGTKMSVEIVDASWRLIILLRLPVSSEGRLLEDVGEGSLTITHTTVFIKAIFLFFVSLPQYLAAVFLTWTGAKFLFFTGDMAVLIMKSIGLAFIVSLDELLFESFTGLRFKELLKITSYRHKSRHANNWHWNFWGLSLLKVTAVLLFAFIIWRGVFQEVTEFRWLCDTYEQTFPISPKGSLWEQFLTALAPL